MAVLDIILASRSMARVSMLQNAGVKFTSVPADIDESAISANYTNASEIALELARQKALHVAKQYPEALVIGSDQVLECEGKFLSKAKDKTEAAEKLKFLRGKTHMLVSGVAVVQHNTILWSDIDQAHLTMKNFDDIFLAQYLSVAGGSITSCVGAYALEEQGAWLFEKAQGDYFTILGMPLFKLLNFLQGQGAHP